MAKTRTRPHGSSRSIFRAAATAALIVLTQAGALGQTATFTMYYPEGRRTVLVRTGSTPEMIALDQLAGTFGLTLTEDRSTNGLTITTRGDRILAFPGQSVVRAAGRIVSLDGPVQRDRNAWLVPIDFLTKALGPAIGQPIVVRRASRLVLVGAVRVPEIAGKIERTPDGARVVLTMQPPTPYKVTRDGNKLTVHFDATALDMAPLTGFIKEFAPGAKIDGLNLVVDLGPSAAVHKVEDDRAANSLTIDLFAAPPPPPPPPKPLVVPAPVPLPLPGVQMPQAPPVPTPLSGSLRTIVIDPGHGGQDTGTVGAGGAKEKDVALQVARRLKTALESRLGLRVLLTRDGDDDVTVDRRTELANNNKADVFLSLHMNWSARPVSRGAQIYTLGLDSYHEQLAQADSQKRAVPVVGGGSRIIEPVPWDLAQLPYADLSATLGGVIARLLAEKNVPLFGKPAVLAPMRVLMGANMPAVLVEMGFLSNADDEKAAATAEWQSAVVEGLIAALSELRRGLPAGAPQPGLLPRPAPVSTRR